MVGICGVLGDGALPESMAEWATWREEETRFDYADEGVEMVLSAHSLLAGEQPVAVDDDVRLWVWGDVYGHGSGDAYTPREGPPDGSARFCARLYREHGLEFVTELNGDFALVIHDASERRLAFVTDRLATHPIYYATPSDDAFVFASTLQALPHHPDVSVDFDRDFLQEFLSLRRVFGLETPLDGVRELPPASVVTVDLHDLSVETTTYWRPSYDPVDKPFSHFATELADTMKTVLSEWTHDDLSYGVLLSGGSDSRLVEACLDQPAVSFHNADWMSREAKVAERVADAAGDEFRLLERYDDHEARSLETTPRLANFSGWFDQAYFTEFEDDILEEVDVVVSGLFADMLFGGGPLDPRHLSLGPVGTMTLPFSRRIDDVDDYVDAKLAESQPLPFFDSDRSTGRILSDNIRETASGLVSHGVEYGSLTDLVMYGDYYPLSADTESIFSRSLMQMCPYRTPFFDNRIIDLHSQVPMRYFLRRNLVNAAVERVSTPLADIPHARTGVPLRYPFPVEYLGTNFHGFYRKHINEEPVPEPHLSHGPWPNRRELLRTRPFACDSVYENEELIRALPFLDYDAVERTLHDHLDGADNTTVIYSLLTFLEMPLVQSATARGASGSPGDRGWFADALGDGVNPARPERPLGSGDDPARPAGGDGADAGTDERSADGAGASADTVVPAKGNGRTGAGRTGAGRTGAPSAAATADVRSAAGVHERVDAALPDAGTAVRPSPDGASMGTELFGVFGHDGDFARFRDRCSFDALVEGEAATVGVRAADLGAPGRSATYSGEAGACALFGEVVTPDGSTNAARWLCERVAAEGLDALDALNGSYLAFVEVDGRAVVATDPVRSWECYYADIGGVRVFGTDVTALKRLLPDPTVERRSLLELLHLGTVLGERTLFEGIGRVPLDSYLTASGVSALSRFVYAPDEFDYAAELAARLRRAIRRRDRYPGRTGVLLSGGNDSRVFLSQLDDVDATYTIGRSDSREVRVARKVAAQYDTSHTVLEPAPHYLHPSAEKLLCGQGIKETLHIHHAGYDGAMDVDVMYHGLLFDTLFKGYFLESDGLTVLGSSLPSTSLAPDPDPVESLLDTLGYLPEGSRRIADATRGVFDDLGVDVDLDLDSPRDFLRESLRSELATCWERTGSPHNATDLLVVKNQPVLPFRTHLADNYLESFVALDAELLDWHLRTPPEHRNDATFRNALTRIDADLLRHRPPSQPHDSHHLNQAERLVRRKFPLVEEFESAWPDRDDVYDRHHLDERLFPDHPSVRDLPSRQQLRVSDARWWLS